MHKRDCNQVVTPGALRSIAKIAELAGRLDALGKLSVSYDAKSQYIKDAALATLKIDDLEGELDLSNIYDAYRTVSSSNLYSVSKLLSLHKDMAKWSKGRLGMFRSSSKGVYVADNLVHVGSRSEEIPDLVDRLLNWAIESDLHPLVKGAVVHFELVYIQPFSSGNGIVGRMWNRLILAEYSDIYDWLPLEVELNKRRDDYFDALYISSRSADPSVFIEFMLEVIYSSLEGLGDASVLRLFGSSLVGSLTEVERGFLEDISEFMDTNGYITNRDAQRLTGLSAESVKKYFASLSSLKVIEARGEKKGRRYVLPFKRRA